MSVFSFRTWAPSLSPRGASRRRPGFRPGVEVLEGRTLLNAGTLDPTFSADGKHQLFIDLPGGLKADQAEAVAVQADGKIVLAGWAINANGDKDFVVARLNADGSPDNGSTGDSTPGDAFGTNGKGWITLGFDLGGTHDDIAHAVAIQPDGKIVVAGEVALNAADVDFAVIRLNSDGSLDGGAADSTPGDNFSTDGKVFVAFDLGGTKTDVAHAVALQPDGKIVVAGAAQVDVLNSDFAVARLTSAGLPDNTFGTLGKQTIAFDLGGVNTDFAFAVAIQPDGKIVVAGSANLGPGDTAFGVARLNGDNGSLDGGAGDSTPGDSFSADGKQTVDFGTLYDSAEAAALQPDGKIVLAGSHQLNATDNDFALARFNSDGSLDGGAGDSTPADNFSTDGKQTVAFDLGNGNNIDQASAVAVQPDGKIVVAGTVQRDGMGNTDMGVARLTAVGTLDATFDGDGRQTIVFDLGDTKADKALGMALQPDGKIVVAGSVQRATAGDTDFGVARLETDQSFRFAAAGAAGAEGGTVTLTVERVGGSTGTASVLVTTVGGSATPVLDYTPVSQLLTFTPGEQAKTITLALKADPFIEGPEAFQLLLSNPTGAAVGAPATATVTVADATSPADLPAQDVTAQVQVLRGRAKRVGGGTIYRQRVTLINVGPQALAGSLRLVLDGLTKKVKLSKPDGITQAKAPLGSSYRLIDLGPAVLNPGAARTVVLRFANPAGKKIKYNPRLLAGVGTP
jgi:uncharacterized delta-60 repeat protein